MKYLIGFFVYLALVFTILYFNKKFHENLYKKYYHSKECE
jgi:hypothetical protein